MATHKSASAAPSGETSVTPSEGVLSSRSSVQLESVGDPVDVISLTRPLAPAVPAVVYRTRTPALCPGVSRTDPLLRVQLEATAASQPAASEKVADSVPVLVTVNAALSLTLVRAVRTPAAATISAAVTTRLDGRV